MKRDHVGETRHGEKTEPLLFADLGKSRNDCGAQSVGCVGIYEFPNESDLPRAGRATHPSSVGHTRASRAEGRVPILVDAEGDSGGTLFTAPERRSRSQHSNRVKTAPCSCAACSLVPGSPPLCCARARSRDLASGIRPIVRSTFNQTSHTRRSAIRSTTPTVSRSRSAEEPVQGATRQKPCSTFGSFHLLGSPSFCFSNEHHRWDTHRVGNCSPRCRQSSR